MDIDCNKIKFMQLRRFGSLANVRVTPLGSLVLVFNDEKTSCICMINL
jgi:hypothetical protein